jgi:hypothetical protein
MGRKKKIEFLMDTDWMFEKPIDREHKEYKLLSYFQKMGDKLDKFELYPGFIELSLHLINLQTLIRDRKLIYTTKTFSSIDDELLVKDLKIKDIPQMSEQEQNEFISILNYSTPRLFEYFNIAKSVWTAVYDSVNLSVKKNKKNSISEQGYFYFTSKEQNKILFWEYEIKRAAKKSPESKTIVKLIYSDKIENLTIPKIISNFSSLENKRALPVFQMESKGDFPIEETLLPLFKRRLISFINQSKTSLEFKKLIENKEVN